MLISGVNATDMLDTELRILQTTEQRFELLLWESTPSIVLSTQDARLPNAAAACRHLQSKGWQIVTRKTGGTAFPQGPGIINLSMILNAGSSDTPSNIDDDYQLFCSLCQQALLSIGIETATGSVEGSFCDGRFNITAAGRKLAGTSQRWSRRDGTIRKLFHCGLLFDVNQKELCDQINTFYDIATAPVRRQERATFPAEVQADKHTSVREQAASSRVTDFLSALDTALEAFKPRLS